MDPISLTDFVDFVMKAGTPKLTQVRTVRARGDYDPATDFWKALREGIISFHENGGGNKKQLDQIVDNLSDKKKVARYAECVAGYKKFLGRKAVSWLKPKPGLWSAPNLDIRVNPELGLKINGQVHIIKLHLKADKVSKRRAETILLLMREALDLKSGTCYAVLDVPQAKLYGNANPDPNILPLLMGEAASFRAIWDHLS